MKGRINTFNFSILCIVPKIVGKSITLGQLAKELCFPLCSRECFTNIGQDITKIIKKLRGLKHTIEELKGLEIKIDLNHFFRIYFK